MPKYAIITGGAGFIGSHLVDRLLDEGDWQVVVIDNFHPGYPRAIKESNLARHRDDPRLHLVEGDILDDATLDTAFGGVDPRKAVVVHLAALVGVRPSMAMAREYHRVNVTGTLHLLEKARAHQAAHFVLASSSSVYGKEPAVPWREDMERLEPVSPYAATKLAAEEFTRVYARLHGLDATVLRFFTVFGPRQRPDLAIHAFFRKIGRAEPIQQFGAGLTSRDYTYVADIVNGVCRAMDRPMKRKPGQGSFEIFNLGHSEPVVLKDLIAAIEKECGQQAVVEVLPDQPGDVPHTYADVEKARRQLGYEPSTSLAAGLRAFADWFREHEEIFQPVERDTPTG